MTNVLLNKAFQGLAYGLDAETLQTVNRAYSQAGFDELMCATPGACDIGHDQRRLSGLGRFKNLTRKCDKVSTAVVASIHLSIPKHVYRDGQRPDEYLAIPRKCDSPSYPCLNHDESRVDQ